MKINLIQLIKEARKNYDSENPILNDGTGSLSFDEIMNVETSLLEKVPEGSNIAIIGDFDKFSICCILKLLSKRCTVTPLTKETEIQHDYFIRTSKAQFLIKNQKLIKIPVNNNKLSQEKFNIKSGGIIFYSTGTTGLPKAILHSLEKFIMPFEIRKKEYKSVGFLLFDHIGGFNTLFHLMFNNGTLYKTESRKIEEVLEIIKTNNISLLPTTPTFLRMLMFHPLFPDIVPNCLTTISYGTEIMHESTLKFLSKSLSNLNLSLK